MANGDGKASGFLSTTTALVSLISVALGAGGSYFWMNQKDLAEHQTNQIKIALALLSERNTDNERGLRAWAVDVIDYYSPVKIPAEGKELLISGDAKLLEILTPGPPPVEQARPAQSSIQQQLPPDAEAASQEPEPGSRLERVTGLQNSGIGALLDGDLQGAVSFYESAYRTWATFRNVQEIRDVLRRRAACVADKGVDFAGDIKAEVLYRLRRYDLRGIDPELLDRLKNDGQWDEKVSPPSNCPG